MLKFLKDLVQTPEQQAAEEMRRRREARGAVAAPAREPAKAASLEAAEAALDALQKRAAAKPMAPNGKPLTQERAGLVRQALEVRKAKQKIFDHLNDEDRARLVAMAVLAFMNQGSGPKR